MNEELKDLRREKEQEFISVGNPGVRFRKIYEKQLKCLELPKGARGQLGISEIGGAPEEKEGGPGVDPTTDEGKEYAFRQLFSSGRYQIIPSFFRTMIGLRKAKREFAVIFRTFGNELDNVLIEFNRFCNGTHPCFNGKQGSPLVRFDGSKGTRDLRIPLKNQAVVYRNDNLDKMTMAFGTTKRVYIQYIYIYIYI